jgi:hypothetical protein
MSESTLHPSVLTLGYGIAKEWNLALISAISANIIDSRTKDTDDVEVYP